MTVSCGQSRRPDRLPACAQDTFTRGAGQLTITVVPDSGAGELTGLAGSMNIEIAGDTHSYDFEYTLAETR